MPICIYLHNYNWSHKRFFLEDLLQDDLLSPPFKPGYMFLLVKWLQTLEKGDQLILKIFSQSVRTG